MSLEIPAVSAKITLSFVLTFLYWYIYTQYREKYMWVWALSWMVYSLGGVFLVLIYLRPDFPAAVAGHQITVTFSGLLMLAGTYILLGRAMPRLYVYSFVLDVTWILFANIAHLPFLTANLPNFLFLAAIYISNGAIFLHSSDFAGLGQKLAGWSFIILGIHKTDFPLISLTPWFTPWRNIISAVLLMMVAVGILLVYFGKARKELAESEKRFRLLAENALDLIYRYRLLPEPKFDYINPVATEITGYTAQEFYDDPGLILELIHPDDRPVLTLLLESPQGLTNDNILRWLHKDGTVRWVWQRNVPIYDNSGNKVAVQVIARDMTEQKRAEEKLRETNEKLRQTNEQLNAVIEASPLAIVSLDREGTVSGWNAAAEKIYGWKAEEVLGRHYPTVPDSQIEEFDEIRKRILTQGTIVQADVICVTKDGRLKDITLFGAPLRNSALEAVGIMSVTQDITEQKIAELEVANSRKKAEQALKMASLGAMAAGIAHEINQPLNSLKIIADSMLYWKKKGREPAREKVFHNLQKISAQADRIREIVQHMRSIINRGSAEGPVLCDLNESVKSALDLIEHQLSQHGIKVTKNFNEMISPIRAHPQGLEEVVVNLMINAMQACDRSGKDSKEIICTTKMEKGVIMEISDNATGIKEELREKIFEPFFSDKGDDGMGLGLFIAHSIVTGIHGRITVRDNDRGGATFRLEFPLPD